MEVPIIAATAAFIVVVLLVIVYLSIRVVQQYEKMVVFRLGKTNESMIRDPGLRFLVPIIDRPVKVDVREQFIEVPSQTTITRDNAPINVDFLIYCGSRIRSRASSTSSTSQAPCRVSRRPRSARSSATSSSTKCCPSANRSTKSSASSSTK